MNRLSPSLVRSALVVVLVMPIPAWVSAEGETPHFARKYGLDCGSCHVSPPKLNDFGEAFVRNNYRMAGLTERERGTLPIAGWASYRMDLPPASDGMGRRIRDYVNRVELISGGQVVAPWLSYFVEWRPVSFETRSDGTLRDRSGRFEDLFLTARGQHLELALGQFRQIAQVDISRRLGVSEPTFFSSSLPGSGPGSVREVSLRGFSLSGRSPGVRVGWIEDVLGDWEWTSYASVALPGEISLPLTSEARREASHELEWAAKGLFLETFLRRGLFSYGAHVFLDSRDRHQVGTVVTGSRDDWMWTGALGAARLDEALRGRWSAEVEYAPRAFAAFGTRAEGQAGAEPAWVTYGNIHFPGTRHTFRLTMEQRFQAGRSATLLELGAIF